MILIIGGMCQGKHNFCKSEFPDAEVIEHYEERIRSELKEGQDPIFEAEKWLNEVEGDFVIIMNEVGSGVVPMDKDERAWRESVGRVSCLFAKRADKVYRLLAGIPQRLK